MLSFIHTIVIQIKISCAIVSWIKSLIPEYVVKPKNAIIPIIIFLHFLLNSKNDLTRLLCLMGIFSINSFKYY